MATTIATILARAEQLAAGAGGDSHDSPVVDQSMTAETLLPHVWQYVCRQSLKDDKRQHLLRKVINLTFTNGVAPIPDEVFTEGLPMAMLSDPLDPEFGPLMSWIPYYFDFQRPLRTMLGYYTIDDSGNLLIRRPGEAWSPGVGYSGAINLTIPCIPPMTDPVDVPEEIVDDVVAGIAGALRGDAPWAMLVADLRETGE